jgi:phosphatidate cytidylyltransferase
MKRIITGIFLAGSIFLPLYLNLFPVGWLIMMTVGCIGLHEYFTMTLLPSERKYKNFGVFLGLLILFASYTGKLDIVSAALLCSTLLLFLVVLFRYADLVSQTPPVNVFQFLIRFVFGFFYIGFLGAHVVLIFKTASGSSWLILLFVIIAMSDSCAYYAGRAFGRHKLCPAISPGKTIEGFIGGLMGATIASLVLSSFLFPQIRLVTIAVIAIVTSCLGVIGDLVESVMKRSLNIKDSGSILPGHGGILDRMDSLLVSAPPFYYMIIYLSCYF